MPEEPQQLRLDEAARIAGAVLEGDASQTIWSAALPEHATRGSISLWGGQEEPALLMRTEAVALVVPPSFMSPRTDLALLRAPNPQTSFRAVARALWLRHQMPAPGVAPSASIHQLAQVGDQVYVGEGCTIGPGAQIGRGAVLHAGVTVAAGARVGAGTILQTHVHVGPGVRIGERCLIHPGAVIGFTHRPALPALGVEGKEPSFGGVVIEDEAEIGPNAVVEGGETIPTRIGRGVHIGALAVVAHDCQIGPRAHLVAMVGLAGDVQVGADALLFGQVGVTSRAVIGERAVVYAQSGVFNDIPPDGRYLGYPARPRKEWLRGQAGLSTLPRLRKRLAELEKQVAELLARHPGEPVRSTAATNDPIEGGA